MEERIHKSIKSYEDLEVYRESYNLCLIMMKEILPNLPSSERYDLKDQLSRSCKAIPRLIAEGYAKKHQPRGFQKYLDDAISEINETKVGIKMCKDIYGIMGEYCDTLFKRYDIVARQTFNLAAAWDKFTTIRKEYRNPHLHPITQEV